MALTLLTRKGALLLKLETVESTDAVPDPATDGILVENIRLTFNPNIIDTNEVSPSLDTFDQIVGATPCQIDFDVYLKGAGSAAEPPEWGEAMKACGFAETITAAAIPAAAEPLAAGGTTKSAMLGTTALGTAQIYRGMPLLLSGAQVGESFVTNYTAAKLATLTDTFATALDATSSYQIEPHVLYSPVSQSIPSATIYVYNDGLLYKFVGNRGNVSFEFTSGGPGKMMFRYMGQFGSKTDAALPAPVYNPVRPPIWKGGAFTIDGVAAAGQAMTVDMDNQLAQPDNPNNIEGFDAGVITRRQPKGSINPKETLVATRNLMQDFRTQTKRSLHGRLGLAAGNRIAVTIPSALYLNQTPDDRNGYRTVTVPFHATGQDAGVYIASY